MVMAVPIAAVRTGLLFFILVRVKCIHIYTYINASRVT